MYSPSSLILNNIIWFLCGGCILFIEYLLVGIKYISFLYIILGIIFICTIFLFNSGSQICRLSFLVAAPLNRNWAEIVDKSPSGPNPNTVLWMIRLIFWVPFAILIGLTHLTCAFILMISIVGVPLAHLHWRMCTLILYPIVTDDLSHRVAHFRSIVQ